MILWKKTQFIKKIKALIIELIILATFKIKTKAKIFNMKINSI